MEKIPRPTPSKFLIISTENIDTKISGPGMRYLEIGRALSPKIDVTLAMPGATTLNVPGIKFASYAETKPADLQTLLESHDIALVTAFALNKFPFLVQSNIRLVVDLYDPYIFENLFYYLDEPIKMQADINLQAVDLLNRVARLGDFFICASERQRDMWLGWLGANGRINPYTFTQNSDLRDLIDVVGIGISLEPPRSVSFLKGVSENFPKDSRIVLWGGGVWDWLDPLTVVRAWTSVVAALPEARLVFLGTKHPNPEIPVHRVVTKLEALAEEIGEKDRTIFFFEWLSFADREALLCEADVGITLHDIHIETRFSIRTRVLDYIWAGLPVLVSEGDVTSQWVKEFQIGKVVPQKSPDAVSQAILALLSTPKDGWTPAFEELQSQLGWSEVVAPLRNYCIDGNFAPDQRYLRQHNKESIETSIWRSRWARAHFIWRTQGIRRLIAKIGRNIRTNLAKVL